MNNEEKKIFARKLALWLDERELDQGLTNIETTENENSEFESIIPFEKPKHKNLQKGDILLISKDFVYKELKRPLFVAVLRNWEEDYWLFAPFSPYSEPATDKELKMECEDQSLRVLSLWNAHTTPSENLKNSWFIGKLSDSERKDALSNFWYSLNMKELPKHLIDRVGPKLIHSEDPRRGYIQEQLRATARIRDNSMKGETNEEEKTKEPVRGETMVSFLIWKEFLEEEGEKLAASNQEKTARYAEFKCQEFPLTLIVRSLPIDNQVVFELETEDEKTKSILDRFEIKIEGVEDPKLNFDNGQCVHEVSLDQITFSLWSPEGKLLTLSEIPQEPS